MRSVAVLPIPALSPGQEGRGCCQNPRRGVIDLSTLPSCGWQLQCQRASGQHAVPSMQEGQPASPFLQWYKRMSAKFLCTDVTFVYMTYQSIKRHLFTIILNQVPVLFRENRSWTWKPRRIVCTHSGTKNRKSYLFYSNNNIMRNLSIMNLLFSADVVELGRDLHLFFVGQQKKHRSKAQTTFTLRFNCTVFSWSV